MKGKTDKKITFDLKNLEAIYDEISKSTEENPDKYKDALIERVRQMTEFQIWGEKHDDSFFDFFCERNVMDLLLKLLKKTRSREVIIQIIQSLSMFLTNFEKPTNINYILSNNAINEFIAHNFDFDDDEITDFYISFLKSLSLRVEAIPLELFYNEKYKDLPLLSQATRFYNHPESMVRTSVQNITLTMLKIQDPKLQHYLSNFPFANYYVNISCYLKEVWLKIDEILPESHIKNYGRLKGLIDDQLDLLMYIDDVFQLKNEAINKLLANALLSYAIIPGLIGSFTSNKKGLLSLNLSLYLIHVIFTSITYQPILETLYLLLFSTSLDPELLDLSKNPPPLPASYSTKWNFKNSWDNYEEWVNERYLRLLKGKSSDIKFLDLGQLDSQNQKSTSDNDIKNVFSKKSIGKSQLEPGQRQINFEEEHTTLTKALGIITDDSVANISQLTKMSPLELKERFLNSFADDGTLLSNVKYEKNPTKEIILSFLTSKDDNMIVMMCCILNASLNNPLIPDKCLNICKMMFERTVTNSQNKNMSANDTTKYLINCLIKLFIVDPPFRIATVMLIAKLIIDLSTKKDETVMISKENLAIFNQGYKQSISKVIKFLQNSVMGDFFVELFETQWKEIYLKEFKKLEKRDHIYMLLPLIEDNTSGVNPYMRLPAGEFELAKREISIFLLFRKIRYSLIKTSKYAQSTIETYSNQLGKSNPSNNWDEGKFYEIDQRKLLPCYISSNQSNNKDNKDQNNSNKQFCYIAEDEENFVLISPDYSKTQWAQILINVKLKNTEAIIDRADPRVLIVAIKVKDNYVDKLISFDDHTLCLAAKRTLDENRRFSKHQEMSLLLNMFEIAKNDMFEFS